MCQSWPHGALECARQVPLSFGLLVSFTAVIAMAQPLATPRELLLSMEVPTVITAAGRAQPLPQAPSAITVITAEDIRRSGATSLPEVLRSVPGLDFVRTSAYNGSIRARGLNRDERTRLRVLVDGLSVYEDVLNLVFWHQIPIALEEIDRIEIVRSPAAALHGDKDFAGVVHIITKSPKALQRTHVSGTVGEAGTVIGNLIHAGVAGRLSYKVSAGYDRTDQFPNPIVGRRSDDLGRADACGYCQINYDLPAASNISFVGGIDAFERSEILAPGFFQQVVEGGLGFLKAKFGRGPFSAQMAYHRFDADVRSQSFVQTISAISNVYHAQLRHGLTLGFQNTLMGGLSYRFATMDSPRFTAGHVDQNLMRLFLQDEWAWRDNLTLPVGVGVDVHSEAGASASPRGSLVYSPWKDHTFRVAVAKAFRNPSMIENFGAIHLLGVLPPPQTFAILGNRDLEPEEILSYELGYQTVLFEVRIDLFHNQTEGLIAAAQPIISQVSPHLPPLLTAAQFINAGDGDVVGGEIGFDVFITSWLTGFLNYSYQERTGDTIAPVTVMARPPDLQSLVVGGPFPEPSLFGLASHHKANVGINIRLTPELSATLLAHHVGGPEGPSRGVNPYTCRVVCSAHPPRPTSHGGYQEPGGRTFRRSPPRISGRACRRRASAGLARAYATWRTG